MKKQKRRKTKKQTTNYIIISCLTIFEFLFLIGSFKWGLLGKNINHLQVILFGNTLLLINIYIILMIGLLIKKNLKALYTTKKGIGANLILVSIFLLYGYFTLHLYNTNIGIYLEDIKVYQQILTNQAIGNGIVGYSLIYPIIYLIGKEGFLLINLLLIIGGLYLLISPQFKDNLINKYQTWNLKRLEKQQAKKQSQDNKINHSNNMQPEIDIMEKEDITIDLLPLLEIKQPINEMLNVNNDWDDEKPIFSDDSEESFTDDHINNKIINKIEEDDFNINVMPESIASDIKKTKQHGKYHLPSLNLLKEYKNQSNLLKQLEQEARDKAKVLLDTLNTFNLGAQISNICVGPSITKYELIPKAGVKISRYNNLHNDLAFSLAAKNVRIEAPIPGKSAIGIEIPNQTNMMVGLKEVLSSKQNNWDHKLQIGLGKDIYGEAVFCEINKTPHLLIAGSTGSGKSVCINTIITSILFKANPDEVKMIMIDPKKVELTPYNGIPHLLAPVVTDVKKANIILQKMVQEMEQRYELFSESNTRNIESYNKKHPNDKLPYIVIIVDELADLMMVASHDVETSIARLAQMARAAGMHLIIATQRPSTDVITGLIKANIPSRIAFAVSSSIDSRTILDQSGAEQLLGKGDMLLAEQSSPLLKRIQGAFLSDDEIYEIVANIKQQFDEEEITNNYQNDLVNIDTKQIDTELDPLYDNIKQFVISNNKASASLLQRQYKIGYNRALRILDQLEANGIISANEGTKPRRVLVGEEDGNFESE